MKIRGNTVGTNIKPERVLEKAGVTPELAEQVAENTHLVGVALNMCSGLTSAMDRTEQQVANNTESIGNIETALDAILTIQNELIGGDGV